MNDIIIDAKDIIGNIKGATLLSVEEYETYKENIPSVLDDWWLRSAGSLNCDAFLVYYLDECYDNPGWHCRNIAVDHNAGVRPALQILDLKSEIGTKIKFDSNTFTVISENYALCDEIVGFSAFKTFKGSLKNHNECLNNYENSLIKEYVDEWFKSRTRRRKNG